jgi:hypothetical protein
MQLDESIPELCRFQSSWATARLIGDALQQRRTYRSTWNKPDTYRGRRRLARLNACSSKLPEPPQSSSSTPSHSPSDNDENTDADQSGSDEDEPVGVDLDEDGNDEDQ